MMMAILLSFSLLYPSNLGISTFYTYSEFTNGDNSNTGSVFLSVDRKNKDYVTFAYERLAFESKSDEFVQDNYMFQGRFWLIPQLRFGMFTGISNLDFDPKMFWINPIISGDIQGFGYSMGFALIQAEDVPSDGDILQDQVFHQWNAALKKYLGPHQVEIEFIEKKMEKDIWLMLSLGIDFQISDKLSISASHLFGEAKYNLEPDIMLLDNNEGILRAAYRVGLGYRLGANITFTGVFSRNDYLPSYDEDLNWGYSVRHLTGGVKVRI